MTPTREQLGVRSLGGGAGERLAGRLCRSFAPGPEESDGVKS